MVYYSLQKVLPHGKTVGPLLRRDETLRSMFRKEGDTMYITLQELIQFFMFVIALIGLIIQITKK